MPAFSPTEPFFGIGMLKISDVGVWNDDLNRLLDVFVAQSARRGRRTRRSDYEFKFSAITTQTRPFYERMIDYFANRGDGYFCAFVVDKRVPGINPVAACGSTWDALITYSITVLRTNIGRERADERAIVVADNYQKPRAHTKYFERELVHALGTKIANVAMADSGSSNLLQLVDVLLGAVMYHHKLPVLQRVDADKKAVADRIARIYGVPTLAENLTKTAPNYFSVWQFRPRVGLAMAVGANQ
ncbi:MAG: DUF3800 domain-containing protein [Candidatus Eremiobacteraeota bacterium]|nr:DUF3800 domain-containing protein [Candidatus Eremiobacteraeota bacterium]